VSRPAPKFFDFIGQQKLIDFLRRQLAGAQALQVAFPHVLIMGQSGMGKTRLAHALATAFGTRCHEAMGDFNRAALTEKMALLAPHDFLMVDEAHRLGSLEQEVLTQAIDHLCVPNFAAEGVPANRPPMLKLPQWTLALATDQPGKLLNALRRRIKTDCSMTHYTQAELKEIVAGLASRLKILLSPQATRCIARVSRGVPRTACIHLENLRLHFPIPAMGQLGVKEIREYLRNAGISQHGLGPFHRRYLRMLARFEIASQQTLALALGIDSGYLKSEIEPLLVRLGFVQVSSAGRRLTGKGQGIVQCWARPRATPSAVLTGEPQK